MHQNEVFQMSQKEVKRLEIIVLLKDKRLSQREGALRLGVSERQLRRLLRAYEANGAQGLVSRQRAKASNRQLPPKLKLEALELIKMQYHDFGPTLAQEKLLERNGIRLSVETVRQLMIAGQVWDPKVTHEKKVHGRRLRREYYGEMIQIDGSIHDWFEGRAPKCTLIVFIDDATSRIGLLRFYPAETTDAYMNAMWLYIHKHGIPMSTYSDKHGVFKVNMKDAKSGCGATQFGRAMKDLGVELIFAHTPQAKGRVERANKTFQDRLVKEMRLRGINDMEAANAFLDEYTEKHNAQFAVTPAKDKDAHVQINEDNELETIFSIKHERIVSKQLTVQHNNKIYQIEEPDKRHRLRQARVTVCEERSGKITILHGKTALFFTVYNKSMQLCETYDAKAIEAKQIKRIPFGIKPVPILRLVPISSSPSNIFYPRKE